MSVAVKIHNSRTTEFREWRAIIIIIISDFITMAATKPCNTKAV